MFLFFKIFLLFCGKADGNYTILRILSEELVLEQKKAEGLPKFRPRLTK